MSLNDAVDKTGRIRSSADFQRAYHILRSRYASARLLTDYELHMAIPVAMEALRVAFTIAEQVEKKPEEEVNADQRSDGQEGRDGNQDPLAHS